MAKGLTWFLWNRGTPLPTNAKLYYQKLSSAMRPVRIEMPDLVEGFRELHKGALKPGALSFREKELIAVSIAVALRCENSIYMHVKACFEVGVTREQILEAAGVAVLMQGAASYTYLPLVVEAMDALAVKEEAID